MENKDKWVIGLDMDGTTLMDWDGATNENGKRVDRIHPLTLEAIKRVQDLGHVVVTATGRNWLESKSQYEQLGLRSYSINSAGAHVHNPSDAEAEEFLDGVPALTIKQIIEEPKIKEHIQQLFVDNVNDTYMKIYNNDGFEIACHKFWSVQEFDGEFEFDSQCTVLTLNLTREEIAPIRDYLESKYEGIHFTNWGIEGVTQGIEFNPSKSNKGTGVLQVAKALNIPLENTMGFGDAENDIELLNLTAQGVVMENGLPHIKELGDHITELDNNNGGVGHFLNKWFNLGIE